ncbi:MAG: response regulator [Verrucomicrobia bacterium]|nr:response regulator [Verrucomicrobiota bacterium]MCH8512964.1 response regulator [Kiritimatiellia bacterium]
MKHLRVLVLDDDEKVLRMFRFFFRNEGYDVETASNGREGLALMARYHFHLVVVDLKMPVMDGLSFSGIVARIWPWQEMIICTGFLDPVLKKKIQAAGIQTILEKPISLNTLHEAIQVSRVGQGSGANQATSSLPDGGPSTALNEFRELAHAIWNKPRIQPACEVFLSKLQHLVPWESAILLALDDETAYLFARSTSTPAQQGFQAAVAHVLEQFELLSGQKPDIPESQIHLDFTYGKTPMPSTPPVYLPIMGIDRIEALLVLHPTPQHPLNPVKAPLLYYFAHHFSTLLQAIEEIHRQSLVDPLTGLFNRQYLHGEIERAWLLAKRARGRLSLLMLDLDGFKSINDSHGHTAGDEILLQASNLLQEMVRQSDLLVRIGGDEFVVFIPPAADNAPEVLAERILKTFQNHVFEVGDAKLSLTLTIGFAHGGDDSAIASSMQLMECADQALYEGKRAGGNRVQAWVAQHPESRAPGPHPILVVDDDPHILQLVSRMLSDEMYAVTRAESVDEALTHLKNDKFDLLITDLSLPKRDGLELLRQAQAIDPIMPCLVITGYSSKHSEDVLRAQGVLAVLEKPFTPNEIRARVHEALAHRAELLKKARG